MSTPRQYELIYIVSPDASEQEVTDLHTQVETIIARIGGELVKTENWGRRKMAYEIGPHKEGVYVLEVMNGSGELMKETRAAPARQRARAALSRRPGGRGTARRRAGAVAAEGERPAGRGGRRGREH